MQKNWVDFYAAKKAPDEPSSFARFVMGLDLPGETLVDLGSGNGRDTMLLAERYVSTGIDPAALPATETGMAFFKKAQWQDCKDDIEKADIVYSRFFLHSVPWDQVLHIMSLTNGFFCAEARAVGDEPKLYPEHERYYVDGQLLLYALGSLGFEIFHYQKSRGLAPHQGEDPILIRVIAKKHGK